MRFVSKAVRCKYVVKPMYRTMNGPYPETVKGLTARFLNHSFDSERAQRELGWTDEDRRRVENHLLAHPDFDRANGIYLELLDGEGKPRVAAEGGSLRCIAFFRNEEREMEQCAAVPVQGSDYCEQHQPAEVPVEGVPA